MYAVISTGGKQYRLEQGDRIEVESLKGEVGDKVVFDQVLALGDEKTANFGSPSINGAQVIGKIVEHGKGSKVRVFKFKRRKMHRKRTGHRQLFTAVEIESIVSGGKTESPAEKKTSPEKKTSRRKVADKDEAKAAAKKTPKTVKKKSAEATKPKAAKKPAAKKSASPASGTKKKVAGKSAVKAESGTKKPQE